MSNPKLILGMLGSETAAFALLFAPGDTWLVLSGFLAFHAVASFFLALFVMTLLPKEYHQPRFWALSFLFLSALFTPGLSIFGLLLGLLIASYFPKLTQHLPYANIWIPSFTSAAETRGPRFGQGGLTARLKDRSAGVETRMQALLAVQAMPTRMASDLLRGMLDDPIDDIRLVAYGLLDQQEKAINSKITAELVRLEATEDQAAKQASLRYLAELYWELIYQGLAQGDVREHALAEAIRFANEAIDIDGTDAQTWVILGKLLTEKGYIEAANSLFENAVKNGYPFARLLPFFTEIAYNQRDFARVRELAASVGKLENSEKIANVMAFWAKREPAR